MKKLFIFVVATVFFFLAGWWVRREAEKDSESFTQTLRKAGL
jgi:hypothetical protein